MIGRRENSGRAKRPFTSPPQWATIRRRGARAGSSSPKRGLSQVVTRASAPRRAAFTAGVAVRPATRVQRKPRERRRCRASSKNERKSGSGASTTTRGFGMARSSSARPVRSGRCCARGRGRAPAASERHEARDHEDRREGEAVGDHADQERGSDACRGPPRRFRPARRPWPRPALVEVGREREWPWSTSPRRRTSPRRSRRERGRSSWQERRRDRARTPQRPAHDHGLARAADRPAAADQPAGEGRRRRSCRGRRPRNGTQKPAAVSSSGSPSRRGRSRTSRRS